MNPGAQTMEVSLQRANTNESWGFRLTGGIDFTTPLSVSQVSQENTHSRRELHTISIHLLMYQSWINDIMDDIIFN